MALLPIILDDILFEPSSRRHGHHHHRPQQHHYGVEDWPMDGCPIVLIQPRTLRRRNKSSTGVDRKGASVVNVDKNQFQINLDVQQFAPEEIAVRVSGKDTIVVEGKHEERRDDHGYVARHFVRRYVLPEGHDIERVVSQLSSDGVLTITAPKVADAKGDVERHVPIVQTGAPSKMPAVEKKAESPTADGDRQQEKRS